MDKLLTLHASYVRRLVEIADRAGVKQGIDIVGPHDTVILEKVRYALARATQGSAPE